MRRRLFSLASQLSMLLCVATVVLWVRSQWVWDGVVVSLLLNETVPGGLIPTDTYRSGCVQTSDGLFMVGVGVTYGNTWGFGRITFGPFSLRPPLIFRDPSTLWRRLGFMVDRGPYGLTYISFPLWLLAAGFLVLPTTAFVKRWRPPDGSCRYCGYNLTGNTSGVCPECGTACTAAANEVMVM